MFSCEISEIFKNTYFEEYLRTTASLYMMDKLSVNYQGAQGRLARCITSYIKIYIVCVSIETQKCNVMLLGQGVIQKAGVKVYLGGVNPHNIGFLKLFKTF